MTRWVKRTPFPAHRAWADFDWGAAADFDRALAVAPASSRVHALRAVYYLVPTGRLCEAEEEMERAVESDPVSPLAYIELGKVLLWARQFDRAQVKLEAAFELRPDYPPAIWYRGAGLFFQGAFEEGLRFAQEAMRKLGPNPAMMGGIGMGLGFLGRHAEASAASNDLAAAERRGLRVADRSHLIYLGLGETDAFFECRSRGRRARSPHSGVAFQAIL
jgi:Tfp pilus assembly protein PilF